MSHATPAQHGAVKLPEIKNEPMRHYEAGSKDRALLQQAVDEMLKSAPFEVPCVVNGKHIKTGNVTKQVNPSNHAQALCNYHQADHDLIQEAIEGALKAKETWETMTWADRAAIFLRAADLIAHKYRYKIMAATMIGQGKNVWQAEIDAAAEICDFLRFGVAQVAELYAQQPAEHSPGVWNRLEYRALEGFVLAVSPFNFTAIGGNLVAAPAIVGNVVVWKPSPMATYSNYLIHQIFTEAGLPDGVIQFTPGPPAETVKSCIDHRMFAALHFTGSSKIFASLWQQIAANVGRYLNFPRIVGETGGKNPHIVHPSADVDLVVNESVRAFTEYQGQKCSALSRLYVPASLWTNGKLKEKLLAQVGRITQGPVHEMKHFNGPVISSTSFQKIMGYIEAAKKEGGEVLAGGTGDDSVGFFVKPTVIETKDPRSVTMREEIFGPVLTCFVYDDAKPDYWRNICKEVDGATDYGLTGAVFARDRQAVIDASNWLRYAAGNFYVNTKCTGAVVGQQAFGGSRQSGSCEKAGSIAIFYRFVAMRTIKEDFRGVDDFLYPSNM